jgi:ABC-type transport system involved in cytochrome c biogenesis permease component
MRFLPVVERELRVSARSPRLYWGRFTAALIAMALVAWIWFMFGATGNSTTRAKEIFAVLAGFSFVYCLILGFLATADTISEEKREGTLGLLFLTNLNGYDVILGKLAANSLHSFYSLISILPVLAIPWLLGGGLTGGDFWRMALVLLGSLMLSLCVGIFISALSKHDRKAQVASLAVMVLLVLLLPGFGMWLEDKTKIYWFTYLYWLSPIAAFVNSADMNYQLRPEYYWAAILSIFTLSILALLFSANIVRRIWQDRPKIGVAFRRQQRFERWRRGTREARDRYREKLLDDNAFYWLSARDRLKPLYVFGFLLIVAFLWLAFYLVNGGDMLDQEFFFLLAVFLHTILKVWVASESGRRFSEDRKSGALELTLSTPLKIRDILEGQFLALFRQFGGAVAIVLLIDLGGMVLSARMQLNAIDTDWLLCCVAGIVIFVVDLFSISALGMWLGLSSKRASRAVGLTVFYILIIPWLLLFGVLTYASLARSSGLDSQLFKVMIGAYFLFSVVIDFLFFLNASKNLTARFRDIATTRFN